MEIRICNGEILVSIPSSLNSLPQQQNKIKANILFPSEFFFKYSSTQTYTNKMINNNIKIVV